MFRQQAEVIQNQENGHVYSTLVVTVVLQIVIEFNGTLFEEVKIVAITKIVLNLMEQNGH
jgi:hypothetical protein